MIGIDIIRINRIEEAVKRGSFLRGAFSDAEKEYYYSHGEKSETVAGIYAAKEAVIKAAGIKISEVRLKEIEILHLESGQPYVKFTGGAAALFSSYNAHVSISHDGDYAIAAAILERIDTASQDKNSFDNMPKK